MKAYVSALAAHLPGRRRPPFRRRVVLRSQGVAHRLAARLPSRRRGLRRWLPLGH